MPVISLAPDAPYVAIIKLLFSYSDSFLPRSSNLNPISITYFFNTFTINKSPSVFHYIPSIDYYALFGDAAINNGYLYDLYLPILHMDRQPLLSPIANMKVVSPSYSNTCGLNLRQLIVAWCPNSICLLAKFLLRSKTTAVGTLESFKLGTAK